MKHHYAFLFFLLFTPFFLQAQANYKKGKVVNLQGDTLRGFIDYREWDQNPQKISFKTSLETTTTQEFTPATSKYFALDGLAVYQQYVGRVSRDITDTKRLTSNIDTTTAYSTVFLKLLQKGKNVSLYSYQDEIKKRFFLQKANEAKPQELIFRRYLTTDGKVAVASTKIYAAQLWNAATAYGITAPDLKRRIEIAPYAESDIVKIVATINGISKAELAQANKASGTRFQYFAGLGLNRTVLQSGFNIFSTINEPKGTSLLPKISVGVDAFLNPDVQKVILRGQISYAMASFNFKSKDGSAQYQLKKNMFSAIPQIIYNVYNKENIKVNIGGGGVVSAASYPKNVYKVDYKDASGKVVSTTERENFYYFPTFYYGFTLRTGVIVNKKVDFSLLYFKPITSNIFKLSPIHFEVNYLFNNSGN